MKLGQKLYVTNRTDWRRWLVKNHAKKKEIWLIYYKKASGKQRIEYNVAVEEALCYGWIDSIVKRIDDQKFVQRFSPRKKGSFLSQANRERVKKLIKLGKMTRAGLAAIEHVYKPGEHGEIENLVDKMEPDVLLAFKKNKKAWANFKKMPASYRQARLGYLELQRRHGAQLFRGSLNNLIKKSEQNKRFGILKL